MKNYDGKALSGSANELWVPENLRKDGPYAMTSKEKQLSDEVLKAKMDAFNDKCKDWNISLRGSYVLFTPYGTSPYECPISSSGLILAKDIKIDTKAGVNVDLSDERFIQVGHVVEVGPEVTKDIKEGDDIMYIAALERALPIDYEGSGDLNFYIVHSDHIIGVGRREAKKNGIQPLNTECNDISGTE